MARSRKPASPVRTLAAVAGAVLAGDFLTKRLAVWWATVPNAPSLSLGHLLRVTLIHNEHSAFSISLGRETWPANVLLTGLALALLIPVCRDLAAIDRRSTVALGLIGGAGLGNLLSLLSSPLGVVDFLALNTGGGRELVMNFADVAAYAGVALLIPAGRKLALALQAERRARRTRPVLQETTSLHGEVAVPIPLHAEPRRGDFGRNRRDPIERRPLGAPPARAAHIPDRTGHATDRELHASDQQGG
jgi:lipoprotein signal peptidase